jgi:RNA polymerase sigma-70 factor (ECF subfamily)
MEDLSKDIIEKAAQGDLGAFEAIYKATSGFVYHTALRILNNAADAQEVTQDIFMKIYDNLKRFEFRSNFKTWVYRITVNTAINAYNKNIRRAGNREDFEIVMQTQGHPPEINGVVDGLEQERMLSCLLDTLTPDHRAIIVLREIEGLSYEEIAASLHITINTVRSRLKRARESLLQNREKVVENDL